MRHSVLASVGCAVFSFVYEQFSHGVYSPFMVGLFAVPLLLGALPALMCAARSFDPGRVARELWACMVLTLTLGCCFAGVLEIYGTTSALLPLYPVMAAVLGIGAAFCALSPTRQARG